MSKTKSIWLVAALACGLTVSWAAPASAQVAPPPKTDAKTIAEADAGLGPCTADFTVTDDAGSPVYAAYVHVHIAYGFMNLHKFDLDVGTNAQGKARFIGLPNNSRQGFYFRATEGAREGSAFANPATACQAQFTIVLRKRS